MAHASASRARWGYIALALLMMGAGPVRAQAPTGQIVGKVTDATDGRPLPLATVQVLEVHRGELARQDGSFAITRLPPGHYTIAIDQLGYDRHVQQVDVRAGASTEVDAGLHVRAIQLNEIVVTGALTERAGQDVLSPVAVVGKAELDRKLTATVAATLQDQPGLAVTSLGPVTGRPVIRGLGGDRILVLEDGARPGDLSSMSSDHAVAIEASTAEKMEVVRGPMSLLYGSSALGGVVNVVREEVPASPPERTHGSFTAQGTSVDRGASGGGFVTGGRGSLAFRAEASGRTFGDVSTPVGDVVNTAGHTLNGSVGAAAVGSWGHGGASYRFYDNDYGIPGGFIGGHDTGVDIAMQRHSVRGEAERHLEGSFLETLKAVGSYTHYHHTETEPSGNVGTEFTQNFTGLDLIGHHGASGPLALGAFGARAQFRDLRTAGTLHTPSTYDYALAGFAVEELGAGALRLQLGARYDWAHYVVRDEGAVIFAGGRVIPVVPRTFGSLSGSAGLLFKAAPGIQLGASVSRAYRTPDVTELYSNGPHLAANSYDVGDPELKQETGIGADAFVRVEHQRLTADVAAFSNWMSDYIFPSSRGRAEIGAQGTRPRFQYTNHDARFAGVEGEVQLGLTRAVVLEGTASYVAAVFTSALDPIPVITANDTTFVPASRYPPLIPPLHGTGGLRYETPKLFAGATARWSAAQERLGDFETRTAGYALLDLDAGVRLLRGGAFHTVTVRVENATDEAYRDHLSRIKEIVPQPGRGVVLMYRLTF